MTESGPKPVVTIAALYGAGGSVIGPRVAERLGVTFIGRDLPDAIAPEMGLPTGVFSEIDDTPQRPIDRFASALGRGSTVTAAGTQTDNLDLNERDLRARIEGYMAGASVSGGVILGRGGMVVLRDASHALHVFLGGAQDDRVRQAMSIQGIDRDEAHRRLEREDEARIRYVQRSYGVDGEDPDLYHLVLDTPVLGLDACVDQIVSASTALIARGEGI